MNERSHPGRPRGAAPRANAAARCAWLIGVAALWPSGLQALGPAAPFAPPRALLEGRQREAAGASSAATGDTAMAATASASAGPAPAAEPAPPAAEGIAGVRLGARPLALIDGQWWPLGARLRGASLTAIERHGVRLQHAGGRVEWLLLVPPATAAAARQLSPHAGGPAATKPP